MLRNLRSMVFASLLAILGMICRAESIDPADLKDDSRLARPVSFHSKRIALKDLLDELSAQTGVDIHVDRSDPASSYQVFAECTDCEACRVMSALHSLFSIREGEWAWVRLGKPGAYSYILRETAAAKNRTAVYDRLRRTMLQNYVALLRRMTPMRMEERRALRNEFRRTLYIDNDELINCFFNSQSFWNQTNFFFRALDDKQQSTVLSGGTASVEFRSLPPDVCDIYRKDFHLLCEEMIAQDASFVIPEAPPDPDILTFSCSKPDLKLDRLAVHIDITIPQGLQSWMGTGHLECGIRDALKAAWMLKGDSLSDPKRQALVLASKETDDESREMKLRQDEAATIRRVFPAMADRAPRELQLSISTALAQLARGSSTPLFAILPVGNRRTYRSPVGKSVGSYLDALEGNVKQYFCKWHDNVLLVMTPDWFAQATEPIPYYLLSRLTPDANGYLPLVEFATFMARVSDDQADWFAEERQIREPKALRACLAMIAKSPAILRPGGVGIDPETDGQVLTALRVSPELFSPGDRPFVRMALKSLPTAEIGKSVRVLQVEAYERGRAKWAVLTHIPYPVFSKRTHSATDGVDPARDRK